MVKGSKWAKMRIFRKKSQKVMGIGQKVSKTLFLIISNRFRPIPLTFGDFFLKIPIFAYFDHCTIHYFTLHSHGQGSTFQNSGVGVIFTKIVQKYVRRSLRPTGVIICGFPEPYEHQIYSIYWVVLKLPLG